AGPLKRPALGSCAMEAGGCRGRHWAKTSPAHGAESSPPAGASFGFALVGESQVTLGSRSWECARRNRGPAVSVSYAGRRKAACPPRRRRRVPPPKRKRAAARGDRKSTRLNSSHVKISYAVFC